MKDLPDSGSREHFSTGSVRDSREGKGRFDLMVAGFPTALIRLAQHFENGARKYDDHNWRRGQEVMRYLDSATRHLTKLMRGDTDEDHAAAAMWNIGCFIETLDLIERGHLPASLDDRPEWMRQAPGARRIPHAATIEAAREALRRD